MAHDLAGDEADAADIGVPILFAEAQPLRQMGAHYVSIEQRHLTATLQQQRDQHLGGGRLAGATQAGEPDTQALFVPRGVRLGQDVSGFRPGEPERQISSTIQVLVAHLCPRD